MESERGRGRKRRGERGGEMRERERRGGREMSTVGGEKRKDRKKERR